MLRDTKIGRVFNRLTDLPSLPKVVEKLLHLPPSAGTAEFADLIATDQGLTAKVLRLINSAFYSLRAPISSIRQASSLLGVRTLKSLALSVSVIQMFKRKVPGFDPVRFWRHALVVALAGQKAAERARLPLADETYVVGLLHDTGIALMVQHFPAEFGRIAAAGTEGTPEAIEREAEEFGLAHPEVGFHLASHWRLPEIVGIGIRHHHAAPAALPPDLDATAGRLIAMVQFGDRWARSSGHSFSDLDRLEPGGPLAALLPADLPPESSASLAEELDRSIADLEALFFEGEPERQPARSR